jgi:BON domain-containing protein
VDCFSGPRQFPHVSDRDIADTTPAAVSDDIRVRNAVMRRLEWDPEVDASAIGVTAREGAVTLTGFIDRYGGQLAVWLSEKTRAEKLVHHIPGVVGVFNHIDVMPRLAPATSASASSTRCIGALTSMPVRSRSTSRATWRRCLPDFTRNSRVSIYLTVGGETSAGHQRTSAQYSSVINRRERTKSVAMTATEAATTALVVARPTPCVPPLARRPT